MAFEWENIAPGMISAGGSYFASEQARKQAEDRARQVGSAQQPYSAAALNQLLQTQQFNTADNAKSRYEAEMALLKPGQENDRLKMMRELQAKGLLGTSTNAPAAGLAEGTAHNPFATSLFAAQEAARQRVAADSLDKSQNTLNQMTNRLSALNANAQTAGINQKAAMPSTNSGGIAAALASILGNKDVSGAIFKGIFGGDKAPAPAAPGAPAAAAGGYGRAPSVEDYDYPGSYTGGNWNTPSLRFDDPYAGGGLFGNDWNSSDYTSNWGDWSM